MNYEKKFILACIMLLAIFIGVIVYDRNVQNACELEIVLENGDTCIARKVNFYSSGFSDVQKCDGQRMTLRTSTIDTIINLN